MEKDILEQLYRKYYKVALVYATSICGEISLAEDLVSEAFIKAYISLPDDVPSFKFWLFKVCKNLWIDYIRKHKRMVDNELLQYLSTDITPEAIHIKNEKYKALWNALDSLSAQERELIILYYFSNFSLQEAAEILGKSYAAVRKKMSRLRETLKQRMEEQGYDI